MVDVGRREDRLLDELEFLYQQRRDVRGLVLDYVGEGLLAPDVADVLLTALASVMRKVDVK